MCLLGQLGLALLQLDTIGSGFLLQSLPRELFFILWDLEHFPPFRKSGVHPSVLILLKEALSFSHLAQSPLQLLSFGR